MRKYADLNEQRFPLAKERNIMFEKLEETLDQFLEVGIPGNDCIVCHNGEVIYRKQRGFADREKQNWNIQILTVREFFFGIFHQLLSFNLFYHKRYKFSISFLHQKHLYFKGVLSKALLMCINILFVFGISYKITIIYLKNI